MRCAVCTGVCPHIKNNCLTIIKLAEYAFHIFLNIKRSCKIWKFRMRFDYSGAIHSPLLSRTVSFSSIPFSSTA